MLPSGFDEHAADDAVGGGAVMHAQADGSGKWSLQILRPQELEASRAARLRGAAPRPPGPVSSVAAPRAPPRAPDAQQRARMRKAAQVSRSGGAHSSASSQGDAAASTASAGATLGAVGPPASAAAAAATAAAAAAQADAAQAKAEAERLRQRLEELELDLEDAHFELQETQRQLLEREQENETLRRHARELEEATEARWSAEIAREANARREYALEVEHMQQLLAKRDQQITELQLRLHQPPSTSDVSVASLKEEYEGKLERAQDRFNRRERQLLLHIRELERKISVRAQRAFVSADAARASHSVRAQSNPRAEDALARSRQVRSRSRSRSPSDGRRQAADETRALLMEKRNLREQLKLSRRRSAPPEPADAAGPDNEEDGNEPADAS
jgi:hypothetical protein